MRRTHGNVHVLDDLDRRLIALLREDPRVSNRAMAERAGVTDETVAARLRRLLETGAMAMTAVVDWGAAGYGARVVARARFDGVATHEAVKPLLAVDEVHAIAETSGGADAVIHALGTDVADLHRFVGEHLRQLAGLTDLVVDVITGTLKQTQGVSTLPVPRWSAADLPAPVVPLDDLDVRILEELAVDGHESNRELARRLDVSDGTIRSRIGRLEAAGLMRVLAIVDPVTTGEVGGIALLFVAVDGSAEGAVEQLIADPECVSVERCLGSSDLVVVLSTPTLESLHTRVSRDVRLLPGVRRVDVASVVDVVLHRAHLGRFV